MNVIEIIPMPHPMKEGYGLTKREVNGSTEFWVSDSTDKLYVVDPLTWKIKKVISVKTKNDTPIFNINDMTFINDFIYANVYLENYIVRINPDTGYIDK
jgi:glutamine cyclotransferase